ncbi:MipA/OmpV family protein [Phyllobacterium sp. YR531]|uniref:MipA/OmpV family protein n=1 Tax=Phyllobacterium sp. YR531 TaxID=1144343 RepID=UPI00026F524B|nr:MipA/OmpV family protein [Phyllobacterium sp. YR531]EJN04969.1 outer membrane protein V [Phyllobacterium sp. YR531]
MPVTKHVRFELRLLLPIVAFGIICLVPQRAIAQSSDEASPERINPSRFEKITDRLNKWNVVIGAGGIYAPKFEGSDEFEIQPFPMFSATFGEHVTVDPRGISINIYRNQSFSFSTKIGYDSGRDEDDSDHLKGLGDIDAGAVIGGKLTYELGPVELFTSFDKTIGGSDGLVGTIGASVSHSYNQFLFSAGASATWADSNHMDAYFGVTKAQSVRSGLASYDAGAGFKRVDFEASVMYVTEKSWLIQGQVGIGYLVGDAADSPIVQDAFQPSAMLMIGYKF